MPQGQFTKDFDNELRAELQEIVDAVGQGICGLDGQGNATFCNHALLKMTGYCAEEIIGKDAHKLLHHSQRDGTEYRPEDCGFRKAIDTHKAVHVTDEVLWRK